MERIYRFPSGPADARIYNLTLTANKEEELVHHKEIGMLFIVNGSWIVKSN